MVKISKYVLILLACALASLPSLVQALPYGSYCYNSPTLSEEITKSGIVVIAEMVELEKNTEENLNRMRTAKFKKIKVIRGEKYINYIDDTYFFKSKNHYDNEKVGSKVLLTSITYPRHNLDICVAFNLGESGIAYIEKLLKLPKETQKRLAFFYTQLENTNETIANDVCEEFDRASYPELEKFKKNLKYDQLIKGVKDLKTPLYRRRTYIKLLGMCGTYKDVKMLESMLMSKEKSNRYCLKALAVTYLQLERADGLFLLEDEYLSIKKTKRDDLRTVVQAICIHGDEIKKVVLKKRLAKSLRILLDNPKNADLVIPTLTKWQDWSVLDKLVKLYKKSDPETTSVRYPIIKYLKACPKQEAKDALVALEKYDPGSFKRARAIGTIK